MTSGYSMFSSFHLKNLYKSSQKIEYRTVKLPDAKIFDARFPWQEYHGETFSNENVALKKVSRCIIWYCFYASKHLYDSCTLLWCPCSGNPCINEPDDFHCKYYKNFQSKSTPSNSAQLRVGRWFSLNFV